MQLLIMRNKDPLRTIILNRQHFIVTGRTSIFLKIALNQWTDDVQYIIGYLYFELRMWFLKSKLTFIFPAQCSLPFLHHNLRDFYALSCFKSHLSNSQTQLLHFKAAIWKQNLTCVGILHLKITYSWYVNRYAFLSHWIIS